MIDNRSAARWTHRLSVFALCLVWPLIWVGGLVTTYDAGMAVPDWPNTYGYNLFLYPYQTWLSGPFDLFIEHGHRMLGAAVGVVAIAIVISTWQTESRRWVFWLAVGLLVAVIIQGLLGGLRVRLGDRTLAMVHGCVGPAFFAICVAMAAVTGPWWRATDNRNATGDDRRPHEGDDRGIAEQQPPWLLAGYAVALSYAQLILGARLRHALPDLAPSQFTITVALHLITAAALLICLLWLWWSARRSGDAFLIRPAALLIGLVGVQIALGVGTWVVNYGFPQFLLWLPGAPGFLLRSKGFAESIIVTGHVATGSLILGVATLQLVRCLRIRWCQTQTAPIADYVTDRK
jgi:cytochrome c oxidase assembly protein subunit 15